MTMIAMAMLPVMVVCVVEGLGCGGGGGGSWWGLESAVTARIGGLCGSCVFFSLSELFSRVELVS